MDPTTKEGRVKLLDLAKKATRGPWAVESVGEKGDGSNLVGVAYSPSDKECERPLSGYLQTFDDEGNEIEYYRDELVADCEHRNNNSLNDSLHIAAWNPCTVRAALSHIDKLEAERDEAERLYNAACAEKFQLAEQCDALRAELEQAREALQKIARDQPNDAYWWKHPRVENAEYMVDAWREVCNLMSECARAALANPSETPNGSVALGDSIGDTIRAVNDEIASWPQEKQEAIARCVAGHVATLSPPYELSRDDIEAGARVIANYLGARDVQSEHVRASAGCMKLALIAANARRTP